MFRDAGRAYEVSLANGIKGKLGFALGDLGLDNAFTRHARSLLQHLIAHYLAIYFSDIAAIAPELGEPRIRAMNGE